ncbi:TITIN protein, partial [Aleadryas rufinucha]|nr:TITIN protein [Aleadryas rufinucha]
ENKLSWQVKDLIPNCEYYFRVKAVNKIGGGDYLELRNPIIAEDPKQPPDPPVDLEVHNPTSKSVTLTWKPPLFDGGSKIMGYIIEKLAKGKERWERCNDYLVPLLTYTVKGLEEGKEYQFRVRAENAAGISEPSRITPFVKAVDPIGMIFLAANLQSGLEVKRGDEIILEAHISGSPYPSITWLRNDEVVRPEDIKKRVTAPKRRKGEAEEEKPFQLSLPERMSVDNHKEGESILSVRDSIRADHGTFTIKVENDHGVAKASCEVNVLDTPGPPVNFVFEDLRKNSVVCKWEPPLDDGGSEILNYVLEKKDNTKAEMGWVTVSSTLRHCKFHVTKLIEGKEYLFRVFAENRVGAGPPCVSKPMTAKDPFSPPDAPNKPDVEDVTSNSMLVKWNEPKDNGSPITGYWIEKREINSTHWARVNRNLVNALELKVEGLLEGLTYIFRVCAENAAGPGKFSPPSDPKTAQDPIMPPGPPIPRIADTSATSIELEWAPPVYNGGGDITGYHVYKQLMGVNEWSRCTAKPIKVLQFTVGEVREGADYKLRVTALNAAGEGPPGETEPATVAEPKEPPTVELDVSVKAGIQVMAGQTIKIPATVTGRPTPTIVWALEEGELDKDRVVIENVGTKSELTIKNALRKDHGRYVITATNSSGSKSAGTRVEVFDVPGPVLDLKPVVTNRKMCLLNWSDPEDDGGSEITGFIVERKDAKMHTWRLAVDTERSKCDITGLIEGQEYKFRVSAKNKFGTGPPVEIGPILAVDPLVVPGPPSCPEVKDKTKSSVALAWKPPQKDGGSPIKGYIVEMQDEGSTEWKKVNEGDKLFPTCECVVPNL